MSIIDGLLRPRSHDRAHESHWRTHQSLVSYQTTRLGTSGRRRRRVSPVVEYSSVLHFGSRKTISHVPVGTPRVRPAVTTTRQLNVNKPTKRPVCPRTSGPRVTPRQVPETPQTSRTKQRLLASVGRRVWTRTA